VVLMACPHCGSWSVKADRSLAGRMVCGRCGRPLQGAAASGARSRPRRLRLPAGGGRGLRWLLLLLAVSAALAWLAEAPRQSQPALDSLGRQQPLRR
jgi:DNA-directed RNA polymerase subunit RPC12/RpoP